MSKFFLHPVANDPGALQTVERITEYAALVEPKEHKLVDSPETADIVLVVARLELDRHLSSVRNDPTYRRWRDKALVFCECDNAASLVPGIYTSATQRWSQPEWVRSGPYLGMLRPSELPNDGLEIRRDYLYSFMGSAYTHPIRAEILKLNDDRAYLKDTGSQEVARYLHFEASEVERKKRRLNYDEMLASSSFVLCPRGRSASAIRFYEILRAGRVPVIISDDWQLPNGPAWELLTVRISERNIAEIPGLLRKIEPQAFEMGRLARLAWEEWFAPEVVFTRLADWANELQQSRADHSVARFWRMRMLLSRDHIRDFARMGKNALLASVRTSLVTITARKSVVTTTATPTTGRGARSAEISQ